MKDNRFLKIGIITILLAALYGCNGPNSSITKDHKGLEESVSPGIVRETSVVTGAQTEIPPVNNDSAFWDSLFAQYGDSPYYFDGYAAVEERLGNNAELLLMQGLENHYPVVRWYCAYKIVEYINPKNKAEIRNLLKSAAEDSREYVRNAASFGLAVVDGTFEGTWFVKSAGGRRIACSRYNEARYNDGKIFMMEDGSPHIAYEGLNAAPVAWSPDEKRLTVTTTARTRIDTFVVDVETKKVSETGVFEYAIKNAAKYGFKTGKNPRPDPYVHFIEWSPDSQKVLLSYSFTDDLDTRQTGTVVFNLEKKAVDWMFKLLPAEGEHAEVKKPEGFMWESETYGLSTGRVSIDIMNGDGVYNRTKTEEAVKRYIHALKYLDINDL